MANKTIQSLPTLTASNYNPDQDMFIVQKPNGATHKMTATNVMNPVAGGITFLADEAVILENSEGNQAIDLSSYVPATASIGIFTARQPAESSSYVHTPHLFLRFYTNSSFSGTGHELLVNINDRGISHGKQFFAPIINQRLYIHIDGDLNGGSAGGGRTNHSIKLNGYA